MTGIGAAGHLLAVGLLSGTLGCFAGCPQALAQAGSTGGTIGKTDKSETGSDRMPSTQPRKQDDSSRNVAASSCSRIPGSWSWFNGVTVVIKPDGTASDGPHSAKWSCTNGSVVMHWSHGYTDRLSLSRDGSHLQGTNGFVTVSGDRR